MQKTLQHFFLTLKKPQYLCFPPLTKINVWQLSYVSAMFLISLCFWHCQRILQYAAVPLITFWNSLARNASSQRIELACIIYTVYRVMSFQPFPVFYCWYFFSDGLYSCEECPNFVTCFAFLFCSYILGLKHCWWHEKFCISSLTRHIAMVIILVQFHVPLLISIFAIHRLVISVL